RWMNGMRVCVLVLVGVLLAQVGEAQERSVAGRVVDQQGAAIVNATILIEGSGPTRTTTSNGDGTFVISGVSGPVTVRVLATGFAEWTETVSPSTNSSNLQVTLAV